MKRFTTIFMIAVLSLFIGKNAMSHCEVPCGIYDDMLRIELIKEHITTIEKAMNQVHELEKASPVNYNQLVRWINTKETHAGKIQEIASQYFITQRVKPVGTDDDKYARYITQLTILHEIIIYSMKSKQTTDLEYIEKLRLAVSRFEEAYFENHDHDH